MPPDVVALTRELVDIESTTYNEMRCGEFLLERLGSLGYELERQLVAQAGHPDRFNIYARPRGSAPTTTLSTHFDTVPPYFPSAEDEEWVTGRGACDAKGILAAQICAAEQLRKAGTAVGLLFVVGEERDSAGAVVANADGHGSRYLINGEPTENGLALATKGALRVIVRAHGRMAHSAYPELGDSAIHKLVDVLHDLQKAELPVDPEIGETTLNVGTITGGRAPNVIADRAEAHLLIRLVGPSAPVREILDRTVAGRCELEYSLDLNCVRLKTLPGWPTMVAKYATDISSLTNWGTPLLLGPGTIHVAHTSAERVRKADLYRAVDLYTELVGRLG